MPLHHPPGHDCGECRRERLAYEPPAVRDPWRPTAPSLLTAIVVAAVVCAVAFGVGFTLAYHRFHHPHLECVRDRGTEACHTVWPGIAPAAQSWPAGYHRLCVRLESFRTDAGAGCPR